MNRDVILVTILLLSLSQWSSSALIHAGYNETQASYSRPVVASSNTILVPDDYRTIQQAINAAEEGDTIFVGTGTYYEYVVVDKALSLLGENNNDTIVDGSGIGIVVSVIANNVAIHNLTIQNGEIGIWLGYSRNNILSDTTITDNSYGIYLWGSSNNFLTDNIASDNYDGIYFYSSSDNTVSGNIASNNSYGIHLDSSSANVLVDNVFSSNTNDGIRIYHSDNNVISDSTISNNTYGVYVADSDKNLLSVNKVLNNQDGIYFYYSRNNILTGNTIANNSQYGVFLDSSSNNEIFHNSFIKNIESSRSVNSVNSWDNGVEGNYWSGYLNTDANRDGIGDTPHLIGENNPDNYPLMAKFSQFNLIENGAYMINAISNSTISEPQFQSLNNRTNTVSFKVDGGSFCRISIPHSLIDPPLTVKVDGNPSSYFKKVYSNGTHTWLYFSYVHSEEHEITLIHTPPSEQLMLFQWAIFGLAIITVILFSISVSYYRLFNKQKKIIKAYEREVGNFPVSHEERARMRFIKDVIEREEKLEEFKKKYGIKIQPASNLEDLVEKLGVKKKS